MGQRLDVHMGRIEGNTSRQHAGCTTTTQGIVIIIIMLHFYRAISLTSLVLQTHTLAHINKNANVKSITKTNLIISP